MGLIDKIKQKVKKDERTIIDDSSEKNATYEDIISQIHNNGKLDSLGNLKSVDMKLIKQKHIVEIVKKNKSLDE